MQKQEASRGVGKESVHPCLSCGACCAFFRVEFTKTDIFQTPEEFFIDSKIHRILKGTEVKHRPSCVALQGHIGQAACCGIYHLRPSPCRNFRASYDQGQGKNPRCDEARRRHGLAPLKPSDYSHFSCPVDSKSN